MCPVKESLCRERCCWPVGADGKGGNAMRFKGMEKVGDLLLVNLLFVV